LIHMSLRQKPAQNASCPPEASKLTWFPNSLDNPIAFRMPKRNRPPFWLD
jgi:hypothetical protein